MTGPVGMAWQGPTSAKVAASIRSIRDSRNWSAKRLAEITGIPRVAISKIENGARQVSVDELVTFADALGVSPAGLLDGTGVAVEARRRADELRAEADRIEREARDAGCVS